MHVTRTGVTLPLGWCTGEIKTVEHILVWEDKESAGTSEEVSCLPRKSKNYEPLWFVTLLLLISNIFDASICRKNLSWRNRNNFAVKQTAPEQLKHGKIFGSFVNHHLLYIKSKKGYALRLRSKGFLPPFIPPSPNEGPQKPLSKIILENVIKQPCLQETIYM